MNMKFYLLNLKWGIIFLILGLLVLALNTVIICAQAFHFINLPIERFAFVAILLFVLTILTTYYSSRLFIKAGQFKEREINKDN